MKAMFMLLGALLSVGLSCHPASASSFLELGKNARLQHTIIVSPGKTDAESGDNLKAALAAAAGIASRPYLIKIEPGVYDLGGSVLNMKPYVDIEGSGQGLTVIESDNSFIGMVQGCSNAEIRELSIVNTYAGDNFGIGMENNHASPAVRNVTIEVTAGCYWSRGIKNDQSSPMLTGVSVYVSGSQHTYGILSSGGTPYLKDVTVDAATSGADYSVHGIYIDQGGTEENPVRLENVRTSAYGGKNAYGLQVYTSVLDANNVRTQAENGNYNYGMEIFSNSGSARVANSFVTAKGGFYARATQIENGSPSFSDVASSATGATIENSGFLCSNDAVPKAIRIDNCRISGSSYSINNNGSEYIFYVGASKLDGPVSMTGTWHCAHCYDGDNSPLDASCQP